MRHPFVLTTTCLALLTVSAAAQTKTFNFELFGEQTVPPVTTSGIGKAQVVLDTATGAVSVIGRYANMQGTVVAAHIHGSAPRGAGAGVWIGLTTTGGMAGQFSGNGTLSATQIQALLDGLTYINVHSSAHGGGEIRGQIDVVPGSGTGSSAPGPSISGGVSGGSTLQISCPPSINRAFVLVGLALPACQTVSLPRVLVCSTPTQLSLDLTVAPVPLPGSATIPIPNGLPPFHAGIQCAFLDINRNCLTLSAGHRVAIQ